MHIPSIPPTYPQKHFHYIPCSLSHFIRALTHFCMLFTNTGLHQWHRRVSCRYINTTSPPLSAIIYQHHQWLETLCTQSNGSLMTGWEERSVCGSITCIGKDRDRVRISMQDSIKTSYDWMRVYEVCLYPSYFLHVWCRGWGELQGEAHLEAGFAFLAAVAGQHEEDEEEEAGQGDCDHSQGRGPGQLTQWSAICRTQSYTQAEHEHRPNTHMTRVRRVTLKM